MEKGAATMKRLFLELGGKSATIVLDDADFDSACLIGIGVCMHAGQGCATPTQAHHEAYERAAGRLAGAPRSAAPPKAKPTGDTVGVAVVCADGTAVSLIQSVFGSFGAQLLEPATGLVLHNRAAFFSLNPSSPNSVQAGKRPAHTLVPVTVDYDDGAVAAHATMGGTAQTRSTPSCCYALNVAPRRRRWSPRPGSSSAHAHPAKRTTT